MISIEKSLRMGKVVMVEDRDGDYRVFIPFKWEDGSWRCSGWWGSKERALQCAGEYDGYCQENLDDIAKEGNWKIKIITPEYEEFKVGDMVETLVGGVVGVISLITDSGIFLGEGNVICHRPDQLAPALEDEPEEMTLKEVCKELGRDIKIKK